MNLIKLNDNLRTKINRQQPAINTQMSFNHLSQLVCKSRDRDYQNKITALILEQMNNPFYTNSNKDKK